MTDPFVDALLPQDTDDSVIPRTGVVTQTSPLQISIAGATAMDAVTFPYYTPQNGDNVFVLQTKSVLVVLGPPS